MLLKLFMWQLQKSIKNHIKLVSQDASVPNDPCLKSNYQFGRVIKSFTHKVIECAKSKDENCALWPC